MFVLAATVSGRPVQRPLGDDYWSALEAAARILKDEPAYRRALPGDRAEVLMGSVVEAVRAEDVMAPIVGREAGSLLGSKEPTKPDPTLQFPADSPSR